MSVPLAALCVIAIWSTTALAVKWSVQEVSPLAAVSLRILLASALCLLVMRVMRWPLPLDRRALRLYGVTGGGLFIGLGGTYWAAQSLSSGVVAIAWGLWPLFTGLIALHLLQERMGWLDIGGIVLALGGLWLAIASGQEQGALSLPAFFTLLLAILVQSLSMVALKRWSSGIPAFAATTGSLLVASVLFTSCWLIFDRQWPTEVSQRTLSAIIYLAVAGNLVGLAAYTWLALRVPAGKATLVSLLTPILALLLGHWLNDEPLTLRMAAGSLLVMCALLISQRPWQWLKPVRAR